MKEICVIPARGGSKGIVRKNLQKVNDKTLVGRTIEKARRYFSDRDIYVSTDCQEIEQEALNYNVSIHRRDAHFASDTCSTEESLLNFIQHLKFEPDTLFFAQCTSPFFHFSEFQAVSDTLSAGFDSSFSVYPTHAFQWLQRDHEPQPVLANDKRRQRRQDLGARYVEAGSVYAMKLSTFKFEKSRFCGKQAFTVIKDGYHFEIDVVTDLSIARVLAPYFDSL